MKVNVSQGSKEDMPVGWFERDSRLVLATYHAEWLYRLRSMIPGPDLRSLMTRECLINWALIVPFGERHMPTFF